MFTREHYQKIAATLKSWRVLAPNHFSETDHDDLAYHFVIMFADDNKAFNAKAFMIAAGIDRLEAECAADLSHLPPAPGFKP